MCLKVMPTPTSTDRAGTGNMESSNERNPRDDSKVELVSKELDHLAAIFVFMPGVYILRSKNNFLRYYFSKRKWRYFYTFNHF